MKTNPLLNKIDGYQFSYYEKFFLDTNVWLYLFYPQYSEKPQKFIRKYSGFFDKILQNESLVFTNILQISELTNWVIQQGYKDYKKNKNQYSISFKDYRKTEESIDVLKDTKTLISSMLQISTATDGIFNADEIKSITNQCDKADFNDIYFSKFCTKNNLTLVTHDFDFNALEDQIKLVSANDKFFNR